MRKKHRSAEGEGRPSENDQGKLQKGGSVWVGPWKTSGISRWKYRGGGSQSNEIDEQRMWTQNLKMYIQNRDRDFPHGPVVKTLPTIHGVWVWSLVRELRPHTPRCATKKNQKTKNRKPTGISVMGFLLGASGRSQWVFDTGLWTRLKGLSTCPSGNRRDLRLAARWQCHKNCPIKGLSGKPRLGGGMRVGWDGDTTVQAGRLGKGATTGITTWILAFLCIYRGATWEEEGKENEDQASCLETEGTHCYKGEKHGTRWMKDWDPSSPSDYGTAG